MLLTRGNGQSKRLFYSDFSAVDNDPIRIIYSIECNDWTPSFYWNMSIACSKNSATEPKTVAHQPVMY